MKEKLLKAIADSAVNTNRLTIVIHPDTWDKLSQEQQNQVRSMGYSVDVPDRQLLSELQMMTQCLDDSKFWDPNNVYLVPKNGAL